MYARGHGRLCMVVFGVNSILSFFFTFFFVCFPLQDTGVKQNLIRTVELIGKALHPDHLKNKDFVFSKRADLLGHMQVRHISVLCLLLRLPSDLLWFTVCVCVCVCVCVRACVCACMCVRVLVVASRQSYIKAEPLTTMLRHETVALATDACATLMYPAALLHCPV